MIATGGSGCITAEHKQTVDLCNLRKQVAVICPQDSSKKDNDLHECLDNRRASSIFVEENDYSASLDSGANDSWLAFWLCLVAGSYFLFSKNAHFFSSCRVKPEVGENVSLSDRSIPNERTDSDATATVIDDTLSYYESSVSPHSTCSSTYFDIYSEISDFDRTSYLHSLLSLEEDSEWLSDSMTSSENPSTPLSSNCDSFTEISDVDTPNYWDSLLKLEEVDSEWISDSKQGLKYVQDGSPVSSYKINWGTVILPTISTVPSFTVDIISAEDLLETADIEEFNGDEPLFWPFDGEFNWNSDESSFCTSPRKRLVFDSGSNRIKGCEQNRNEASCCVNCETSRLSMWSKSSVETLTLGCDKLFLNEDFDSYMNISLEYFDSQQEFTIETMVGLKEFDGSEGLDSEFIIDVFMLEEYLQLQ